MDYDLIKGYSSKNYGPNVYGDGVLPAWVSYYGGIDIRHWAEFFAPETKTCQMSSWRWGQRWYMFNAQRLCSTQSSNGAALFLLNNYED